MTTSNPKLNKVTRVEFFPLTHTYLLDGEKYLIGVTELMKNQNLSANYSFIDQEVLDHAADLGTQAHEAIESYCNGEATQDTPLIKSFRKLGLDIIATEYLVTDYEVVASSIDLVAKVDDNTVDLIDMKRTSTVHKDALAAQLGIYKVLFEAINPDIKVRNCYCLPIKKGNKDDILKDTCNKLVEITPMSADKVKAVIEAERDGNLFRDDSTDPTTTEVANVVEGFLSVGFGDAIKLIADLQAQVKEVEESIASAKETIYQEMLAKGVDKLEIDGITLTVKKPYTTNKFDSTAFKKDHADLAEQYTKESEVKGSLIIKIK